MPEAGDQQGDGAARRPGGGLATNLISPTMALVVFALGLLAGFPIAIFGFDLLIDHAAPLFAMLIGLFAFVVLFTVLILAFRRPIWERLFRFGQVEMDRFARPLAEVARHAAEQNVAQATSAAQDLAELVLARYSWIITRRWLVATVTAFIAAIAALAGAALLFQQNQLLAVQIERVSEQTELLRNQIELGEAQRSTSIVPEILGIGEALGAETARLVKANGGIDIHADYDLSSGLRARIVAASNAARPYRYLRAALAYATDAEVQAIALARRPDLVAAQEQLARWRAAEEALTGPQVRDGELTDRPVSPERGQLLSLLFNARIMETEYLTFAGADFSFAEVRLPMFSAMSMQHALLRYADFSTVPMREVDFGGAYLDGARFRHAVIGNSFFSGIPSEQVKPPMQAVDDFSVWRTMLSGADFSGATIFDTDFVNINGLAISFDGAALADVDFTGAQIAAATFRRAILGTIDFTGANLSSVDFDGALVFTETALDDFLAQAAQGTFTRERYVLVPVEAAEVQAHPRSDALWRIDGAGTAQAYRIDRVEDFN